MNIPAACALSIASLFMFYLLNSRPLWCGYVWYIVSSTVSTNQVRAALPTPCIPSHRILLFVYTLIRREDFPRCRFGGNYLKYLTQYSMLGYHLYTRIRKKSVVNSSCAFIDKIKRRKFEKWWCFFLRRSGFGRTDFRIRRDVAVPSSKIRRDVQKWSGRTQIFGGKPSECTHSAFNVVFHLYACTQHCANSQRVFF